MEGHLIELLGNFGAPGLLIGFMLWQQKERRSIDEKRIAADVKLAEALIQQAERISQITQLLTKRLK